MKSRTFLDPSPRAVGEHVPSSQTWSCPCGSGCAKFHKEPAVGGDWILWAHFPLRPQGRGALLPLAHPHLQGPRGSHPLQLHPIPGSIRPSNPTSSQPNPQSPQPRWQQQPHDWVIRSSACFPEAK